MGWEINGRSIPLHYSEIIIHIRYSIWNDDVVHRSNIFHLSAPDREKLDFIFPMARYFRLFFIPRVKTRGYHNVTPMGLKEYSL
jgi:hypothetical protein